MNMKGNFLLYRSFLGRYTGMDTLDPIASRDIFFGACWQPNETTIY